jgi:YfiH family protein
MGKFSYHVFEGGWLGLLGRVQVGSVSRPDELPPLPTIQVRQVHGVDLLDLDATQANDLAQVEADGLHTTAVQLLLVVRTADCLPLYLSDGRRIALIHAGWRGCRGGIIQRAVALFPQPRRLLAVLGPSISQAHYEVDEDLYGDWLQDDPSLAAQLSPAVPGSTRRHLDLGGFATATLLRLGLRPDHCFRVPLCTFRDGLPSYRRDRTDLRLYNFLLKMG